MLCHSMHSQNDCKQRPQKARKTLVERRKEQLQEKLGVTKTPIYVQKATWGQTSHGRYQQKKKIEKGTILSEESERDKLISAVSDRYLFGNLVRDDNPDSENQSFETKMKFKKQKAVLLQIAARIKSKGK